MGKRGARLSGFCLNRIKPHARVRSTLAQANKHDNTTKATTIDPKIENSCNACGEKPMKVSNKGLCLVGRS